MYTNNNSIRKMLEEQFNSTPNNIAVENFDYKITFAQLDKKSNQLAKALINGGIVPGNTVALLMRRSAYMIIAILAALKVGAGYVIVNNNFSAEEQENMIKNSKAKALLAVNYRYNMNIDLPVYNLERMDDFKDGNLPYAFYNMNGDYKKLINNTISAIKKYNLNSDDIVLQKTPGIYKTSIFEMLIMLFSGAKLCILNNEKDKINIKLLADTINDKKITVCVFNFYELEEMLSYAKDKTYLDKIKSLKKIFIPNSDISPYIMNEFKKINIELCMLLR